MVESTGKCNGQQSPSSLAMIEYAWRTAGGPGIAGATASWSGKVQACSFWKNWNMLAVVEERSSPSWFGMRPTPMLYYQSAPREWPWCQKSHETYPSERGTQANPDPMSQCTRDFDPLLHLVGWFEYATRVVGFIRANCRVAVSAHPVRSLHPIGLIPLLHRALAS